MIPPPTTMQSAFGFNLLELMVSVFIVCIVASVGTQSYFHLMEQVRANTAINELFYHLAFARSEAIKSNSAVTLCASHNGTTCTEAKSSKDWSDGYMIFEDKNEDRQKQATEKLLWIQGRIYPKDKLYYNSSASGQGVIQFTSLGDISENASSFLYCPSGGKTHAKAIFISRMGRIRIVTPQLPTPSTLQRVSRTSGNAFAK